MSQRKLPHLLPLLRINNHLASCAAPAACPTCRPLDVFFVLLVDPYCLVSSTSHSTHHHHWGWHLKLPVTDPADTLTLVGSNCAV